MITAGTRIQVTETIDIDGRDAITTGTTGTVTEVDGDNLYVRFDNGTAIDVHADSVEPIPAGTIAEDDYIYATESIRYDDVDIPAGSEGQVLAVNNNDAYDLLVTWDAGFVGTVNSGSVALVTKG